MTSSVQTLPAVDASTKDPIGSSTRVVPRHNEQLSPLMEIGSPLAARPNRGSRESTGAPRTANLSLSKSQQQPKQFSSELARSGPPTTHQSLSPSSPLFNRSELTSGLLLHRPDEGRMPILSSTEEGQPSVNQPSSDGSPLMPRRLGGLRRSPSKENRHTRGGSASRKQTSGRNGSTSRGSGSGSGTHESQDLGASSFSAVQVSVSRHPSVGRQSGPSHGATDNLGTSMSSLSASPAGARHGNKTRTGSDAAALPLVSVDVSALNTSCSEEPFNTSRTLRGARAVLRRKQFASFRLGTSRTMATGMNSSLARRSSINNRTISFVGADDDAELYSPLPSDGLPTPSGSPRQRTRLPQAGSSSSVSTLRVPSAISGGPDKFGNTPAMERVNADSAFLIQTDDDGGSHSRRADRGRDGWASGSHRAGVPRQASSGLDSDDGDDADADLHDRKVQTLLEHLSRSGFTNASRRPEGANAADVPNLGAADDASHSGSQRVGLPDEQGPLNESNSTSFPVLAGGWSGLGGGDVSAVTSNDWYARMRMKVSQDSDDDDSVQHPNPTPPPPQAQPAATGGLSVSMPVPPSQFNLSPSPKTKLDQNKDIFMQPPTPVAHARGTVSSDQARPPFNSSSTAVPTSIPLPSATPQSPANAMAPPSAVMMSNGHSLHPLYNSVITPLGSPSVESTGTTTHDGSRRSSGGLSLGDFAGSLSQPRLSNGPARALASASAAAAAAAAPPPPPGRSPAAATAESTPAAPPRAAYRRSSRRSHPSESMPLLSVAATSTAAQDMGPPPDQRATTAKGAESAAAARRDVTTLAQLNGFVRPLSGSAAAASARSPFKSATTSQTRQKEALVGHTTPSRRWSAAAEPDQRVATDANNSAPASKTLHRSATVEELSAQGTSTKTTPGRTPKAGGYVPVRRQSTNTTAGSAGASGATVAAAATAALSPVTDPPSARLAGFGDSKTPQVPTARRTTVRRRSSQPLSVGNADDFTGETTV